MRCQPNTIWECKLNSVTTKQGTPKTWGEAIESRIGKQKAAYREKNPNGSWATEGKK